MNFKQLNELKEIIKHLKEISIKEKKLTGFCIGNTRKINETGLYFSPIRNTQNLVAGSVIIYSVEQAISIVKEIDGIVDYILIDTEKKISHELYGYDNVGNVERALRENVKKSKILTYKGNDITVDAIDSLVVQILSSYPRGVSGKKAGLIGVGNIGSKLALKLVERGMYVSLLRRDKNKLETIVKALNIIKPQETISEVVAANNNISLALGADVLIGLTPGTSVITKEMINVMAIGGIIIDVGKGSCELSAIQIAKDKNIRIYRADIRPAFAGLVCMLLETERVLKNDIGRANFDNVKVISGGMLGDLNEVVVDSIFIPKQIYGIADGKGDFIRKHDENQIRKIKIVQNYINSKNNEYE